MDNKEIEIPEECRYLARRLEGIPLFKYYVDLTDFSTPHSILCIIPQTLQSDGSFSIHVLTGEGMQQKIKTGTEGPNWTSTENSITLFIDPKRHVPFSPKCSQPGCANTATAKERCKKITVYFEYPREKGSVCTYFYETDKHPAYFRLSDIDYIMGEMDFIGAVFELN